MFLAGDIGGTNVRLALFTDEDGRLVERKRAKLLVREHPSLEAAVGEFLRGEPTIRSAAIDVAGPVRKGRARGTNITWVVDEATLSRELGVPAVVLNDLEANGWGLAELGPNDFAVVNAGEEDPEGNGALISAGTGLGEAILARSGNGFRPIPSEGGHASFAPRDDEEIALLKSLLLVHHHVSYERVVSGPGLATLYRFERSRSAEPEPAWLAQEIAGSGDPAPVVSRAALAGRDPVCVETLRRFVSIYGSEAANLALKSLATGGVFVGGGIAPRILPVLLDGGFFAAFCAKGRFRQLLSRVPVKVVLNDACALLGAARGAARAAAG